MSGSNRVNEKNVLTMVSRVFMQFSRSNVSVAGY